MRLSAEDRERFMHVDPANIGHNIEGGFMRKEIKPVCDEMKVVGTAFTVRIPQRDSTALYYAMMTATEGDVIVIDKGSDDAYACVGEWVAVMAKTRGIAGIVIDGPATDKLALKQLGFPVFCTGFSPITSRLDGVSGEVQIPIQCGGAVVKPGSIIVGDADGVIVVPDDYGQYLVDAEKKGAVEQKRRDDIRNGYRWEKRNDFDVVKFFGADVAAAIEKYKNDFPARK
jgi:regulator of RNase E activity RraA